ncbi:Lcl domain-containing protein [Leptospira ryugenii]|uniref:Lcl domain-containing protein n=1 Tax=Leptospira ryugenii TaxID=1917863 RepID=UPI001AE60218|nr:DUF1566 domain-containing protein [Leptospira ryugenii]
MIKKAHLVLPLFLYFQLSLAFSCKPTEIYNICDSRSNFFYIVVNAKLTGLDRSNFCNFRVDQTRVSSPRFLPKPGTYTSPQSVRITNDDAEATVYYTTDGSIPNASSPVFKEPFLIPEQAGTIFQAIAIKPGTTDSEVVQAIYSYSLVKTGQIISYAANDDGALQKGSPRNYTGPSAPSAYPADHITRENTMGIIWKSCTQGFSGATCVTAVSGNQFTFADASLECSNMNSLNAGAGFAGFKTWRLPTMTELLSTNDASKTSFTLSATTELPVTFNFAYWSSTPYPFNTGFAWYLDYSNGNSYATFNTNNNYHARCVASSSFREGFYFTVNTDGTVFDRKTGLLWQRCAIGQNNDATCSGSASPRTWTQGLSECAQLTLAGKTWRLPNRNELASLYNYALNSAPFIDRTTFPNVGTSTSEHHWTSTTDAINTTRAWYVNFTSTINNIYDSSVKTTGYFVRCVADN